MKPTISIIVAVAKDGAIGRGGDLAFHIRADLRHFKQITMGHPLIMGRRTFESLPGGALPDRLNIVVTGSESYSAADIAVAHSVDEALAIAEATGSDESMVIGGGNIYAQMLPRANRIYLTEIDAGVPDADTFFPSLEQNEWEQVETGEWMTDERSGARYRFVTLQRRH